MSEIFNINNWNMMHVVTAVFLSILYLAVGYVLKLFGTVLNHGALSNWAKFRAVFLWPYVVIGGLACYYWGKFTEKNDY